MEIFFWVKLCLVQPTPGGAHFCTTLYDVVNNCTMYSLRYVLNTFYIVNEALVTIMLGCWKYMCCTVANCDTEGFMYNNVHML